MTDVSITADAGMFTRALTNVLALCPARSGWPVVLVGIGGGIARFTASDSYTAGTDTATGETTGDASVVLDRKSATELAQATRGQRKQSVILTLGPMDPLGGRLLHLAVPGGMEILEPFRVRLVSSESPNGRPSELQLFGTVGNMLRDLENRDLGEIPAQPWAVAFQQSLIQPFSKVRGHEDGEIMDLLVWDSSKPIYVKIGPTFRGIIVPISREHAPEGALF